ncbi:11252_t:CDS:1 [Funneliformis geosporum]|uniref:6752_t:CDS:1 n=1 Tax=Funneliformis geosporum TaxID=1117311 RepID=A0A9W4X092_9GLOM|nr:11252_t:CDS:1 [Funneliformis geosporum]CAI2176823.1 6752_t:CDS:1 [Funneliformis geosporum]
MLEKNNKSYYIHYYNHREDPNIPFPNIVYPNPPPPPLINKYCNCGIMSIRKQVKSGKNRGKLFYSCSKFGTSMHDERCEFFCWEEPRMVNTPLKFSRHKKSLNDFFCRKYEENTTPTKPSHASPVKTISQLYNSSKYTRSNKPKYTCELNTTSTMILDKKKFDRMSHEDRIIKGLQDPVDNNQDIQSYLKRLEKKLDDTKRELNRTKVECNNLETSNVGLKRKLQDEKERNESLVKSNKRIRKDLNDKNKKILRMMQQDAYK